MLPTMTEGVLSVAEDWTGYRPNSCPWRAFTRPIVRRVLDVYSYFESGQLAWVVPRPSHKLVQAITHYHRALRSARAKKWEKEAEKRNG